MKPSGLGAGEFVVLPAYARIELMNMCVCVKSANIKLQIVELMECLIFAVIKLSFDINYSYSFVFIIIKYCS